MEQDNRIDELIAKAAAGTLSDEELAVLVDWYNSFDDSRVVLPAAEDIDVDQLKARIHQRLMERINPPSRPSRTWNIRKLWPYAAAVLVLIVAGIHYFSAYHVTPPHDTEFAVHDVAPGGNRATLTLADNRTVILSEEQEGIQIGDEITYLDGSLVQRNQVGSLAGGGIYQLTLSTPNGGTYQVTLPDGTKVWLNAGSTLRYPNRFTGGVRVVELVGEAYFSVARAVSPNGSGMLPFRVVSNGHEIDVLGTEFNVSAYPEETEIKTTLVSGKVNVKAANESVILMPGQQSTVGVDGMLVQTVDADPYVAWKNGRFHFQRTPLEEIMKQMSRWYDVEVVYTQDIPQETFSGKVRRNVSLMGVLNILQLSTIDIELQDKTLIINGSVTN